MTEVSRLVTEDEDYAAASLPKRKKDPSRVRKLVGGISTGIVSFFRRVGKEISDPFDWHAYGGLALVAYGCWLLRPAVGFITLGVGIILIAVLYGAPKREGNE